MTFLHVAFLGGALAIAVPIILHLVMRKQPMHLEFPALRFLKLRESTNRRQLRFRHWLLLALRCALLLLLALALARPSIVASSGILGDQEAPVAAALVFDTNPRMQYRHQNKTRLEVAQETATWLLRQLPRESDVSVVDSRSGTAVFSVDVGAARQRIERLDAASMSQPLVQSIEAAIELLNTSLKQRKEIYVFTDLSQAAWSPDATRELASRLAEQPLGIYLIDVGVKDPQNFGIGQTSLSGDVLSKNAPLMLQADILHAGQGGERTVELVLNDPESGDSEIRGRKTLQLAADGSQRATFQLRNLSAGLHQGRLQLVGEDALPCDDQHWFTVDVRPAWRILLAAPSGGGRTPEDYGLFLSEALAPYAIRAKGEAAFQCDVIRLDQLADQTLSDYAAVCLIDPTPLEASIWQKLHAYVAAGGGLGVFLGGNATPVQSFNEPVAQEVLPGKLARQWRSDGDVYFAPDNYQHPVLSKFQGLQIAWPLLPIFRHWQLEEMADGAATIAVYSNNQPALIDRPVGKGRVLTMTTSASDPANRPGQRNYVPWNLLPTGDDRFPFYLLANTIAQYLVGSGDQHLNYTAGGTAVVRLTPEERQPMYVLTTPRGDQIRTPPGESQDSLVVTSTEAAGNYQLSAGGGEQQVELGFSVNLPPSVSDLTPVTDDNLKAAFGDTPFRLARDRDEIDRSVSAARVGQELFPYLIVLLVLVLAAEQVLSNRFYQDYDTKQHESRAAQLAHATEAHEATPAATSK